MTKDDDLYWYDDATYQQGIHFYYPHTKEIKNLWAFKVCLAYWALLTFLLPLCVALHQRRIRLRREGLKKEAAAMTPTTALDPIGDVGDDSSSYLGRHQHNDIQVSSVDHTQSAPERFFDRLVPYEISYVYDPGITSASGWRLPFSKMSTTSPVSPKVETVRESTESNCYVDVDNLTESSSRGSSDANLSSALSSVDVTIDLFCGPRPWYCYYCSCKFWHKIRKCATWDDEMEKIVGLALPYTASTIIQNVFDLLEAGVIGRVLGTANLTAYYTVDMAVGFATMFLHGVLSSLTVLVSHAIGAENYTLAGIYVQLSLWTHQIFFLPILIVGWKYFDQVVLHLGFDEDLAATAQDYARFALLDQAVGVYNTALHYVLGVSGQERYSMAINGVHSATSFVIVLALSELVETTRLSTIGAVHLGLTIIFSIVNILILLCKKWFHKFWRGMFFTNPFRECGPIGTFVRAAIPLSCGYVIDYCEWDVLFIFSALQGPAEVAAWGLLGNVWGVMEDVVVAVSDASEVRVAHLLGLGKPAAAKRSSDKSIFLGVLSGCIMAAVLIMLRKSLPKWLTNDGILQRMLTNLMPITSLGLALLSLGNMSWSILCAQGRTPLATAVTGLGSLFVTLPLASVSTFHFNFNLQGLASCLVLGYATSGFVNTSIMLTTNWKKISRTVRKRTKHMEETMKIGDHESCSKNDGVFVREDGELPDYHSFDFDELPDDVRQAAMILGYNQQIWDQGLEIEDLDVCWDELPDNFKAAALKLGYD